MTLERGRHAQFYTDMLATDAQSMNLIGLQLNPFDYYIFNFALHLINNNQNRSSWENWNSVYFALACDYLMHFLPSDPNVPVMPHIPPYSGKMPLSAPLQTANRPLYSPSLLLIPDVCNINNQHNSTQNQSRNEIWRSETVLQVFIDIWMSVEPFNTNIEIYQKKYLYVDTSPERVRLVRVLVKHIHSFSAKHLADSMSRSSTLRKYAQRAMCTRGYLYVMYLVRTWPLDASFRLVMELWLSLIQPWRYTDNSINQDRYPGSTQNQEEASTTLDSSFIQFIAENFPSYTCIFQLVISRFMKLDLTTGKNAIMLFRLGKVFSQQHLVPVLRELENAIFENNSELYHNSLDATLYTSSNNQSMDLSYNGVTLQKWVAVAKQAISEFNISTTFEYEPIWSESRNVYTYALIEKIMTSKVVAERIVEDLNTKLYKHQDFWSSIKAWFMMGDCDDEIVLEECKKVPTYLNACLQYFLNIFNINNIPTGLPEPAVNEDTSDRSSFANSFDFSISITNKLRNKSDIRYMGDPDLMPIMSNENTILVRMLYQISSKVNEMFHEEFSTAWNRNDFWGYVAREILQKPCTISNYVKDNSSNPIIVSEQLPARLSLRRLGSYDCIVWATIGYIFFRILGYSGVLYIFFLISVWLLFILIKSLMKMLNII